MPDNLCGPTVGAHVIMNSQSTGMFLEQKSSVTSDLEAFPLRLLQPYAAQVLDLLFTAVQPESQLEVVPAAVFHSHVVVHPQQPMLTQHKPPVLTGQQQVCGVAPTDAELKPGEDVLAGLCPGRGKTRDRPPDLGQGAVRGEGELATHGVAGGRAGRGNGPAITVRTSLALLKLLIVEILVPAEPRRCLTLGHAQAAEAPWWTRWTSQIKRHRTA